MAPTNLPEVVATVQLWRERFPTQNILNNAKVNEIKECLVAIGGHLRIDARDSQTGKTKNGRVKKKAEMVIEIALLLGLSKEVTIPEVTTALNEKRSLATEPPNAALPRKKKTRAILTERQKATQLSKSSVAMYFPKLIHNLDEMHELLESPVVQRIVVMSDEDMQEEFGSEEGSIIPQVKEVRTKIERLRSTVSRPTVSSTFIRPVLEDGQGAQTTPVPAEKQRTRNDVDLLAMCTEGFSTNINEFGSSFEQEKDIVVTIVQSQRSDAKGKLLDSKNVLIWFLFADGDRVCGNGMLDPSLKEQYHNFIPGVVVRLKRWWKYAQRAPHNYVRCKIQVSEFELIGCLDRKLEGTDCEFLSCTKLEDLRLELDTMNKVKDTEDTSNTEMANNSRTRGSSSVPFGVASASTSASAGSDSGSNVRQNTAASDDIVAKQLGTVYEPLPLQFSEVLPFRCHGQLCSQPSFIYSRCITKLHPIAEMNLNRISSAFDTYYAENPDEALAPRWVRNLLYISYAKLLSTFGGRRKRLPRCVEMAVRFSFPNVKGEPYVGFQSSDHDTTDMSHMAGTRFEYTPIVRQ